MQSNWGMIVVIILKYIIFFMFCGIVIKMLGLVIYGFIYHAEDIIIKPDLADIHYKHKEHVKIFFKDIESVIVKPLGGGAFRFLFYAESKNYIAVMGNPEPIYSWWLHPILNDLSQKCDVYWSYGLFRKRKKWCHTDPGWVPFDKRNKVDN